MAADNPGENFLGRWSRRKAEVRAGDATAVPPTPADDAATNPLVKTEEKAEAPAEKVLTDADMPPIESLSEDSDYSGFLSPGVSEGLRKMALRKLFGAAGFNVRDGLDDYDDDFRNFAALGDLITSDMRHRMERDAERKAAAQAGDETENETADENDSQEDEEEIDALPGENEKTEAACNAPANRVAEGGKNRPNDGAPAV